MDDSDDLEIIIVLGGKQMELSGSATKTGYCLAANELHLSIAFSSPEWKPASDCFLAITTFPTRSETVYTDPHGAEPVCQVTLYG